MHVRLLEAPSAPEYVPAEQLVHEELADDRVAWVPGGQFWHVAELLAPAALEYVPEEQGVHWTEP